MPASRREKTEVVFTIDSPSQEPLARAIQEFLESHHIPCAITHLPFITALPNPQWGNLAVRDKDAPYARLLIAQFLLGEPATSRQPKKATRQRKQPPKKAPRRRKQQTQSE